jgi:GrpB-like predicted nucleotidyltransferase (UPF0157 family)
MGACHNFKNMKIEILKYSLTHPSMEKYDPRYSYFAKNLIDFLRTKFPTDNFFHFGSTAILNCHGKPILDIFLITNIENVESRVGELELLGFQYPYFRDKPINPKRPCRVAKIQFGLNEEIHAHVHIVEEDSETLSAAKNVIKSLSASNELMEKYIQTKRDAILKGSSTFPKYSEFKKQNFWASFDRN